MKFLSEVFFNQKFFKILTIKQKIKLYKIILLMFFGAILELIGIGLIIPFITMFVDNISNPNILLIKNFIKYTLNFFYIESTLYSLLIFLFFFFIFKAIFLTNLSFVQSKFIYNLEGDISKRIYQIYLNQSYNFFVKNNNATLIQNVLNEPMLFNGFAAQAMMLFLAEIMVIIGILFLLIFIQPLETLFLLLMSLIFVFIWIKLSKKRIEQWGILRQENLEKAIKHLQQGIFAIKEIKIFNKKDFFLNRFNFFTDKIHSNNSKASFTVQLPRLWSDFFAIFIILLLVFFLSFSRFDISLSEILPIVALYLASAFRVIPSINRSLHAAQQLSFAAASINRIYEQMNLPTEQKKTNFKKIIYKKNICLKGVNFFYNKNHEILKNINLEINKGEHVAIVGPSGSGKTTILNLMTGLIKPNRGLIEVDGINIHENLDSWWTQIGYVPQNIYLLDDTLLANIVFGEEDAKINFEKVTEVIRLCALDDLVKNLSKGIMTNIGERAIKLSGGQIQRIGIARCLYVESKILFFDEATNALDVKTESEIFKILDKLRGEKTVISISHRLLKNYKYDKVLKILNGDCIIENYIY
jgi:ABC-type multidrug transport system fused ATPase/permease subunit